MSQPTPSGRAMPVTAAARRSSPPSQTTASRAPRPGTGPGPITAVPGPVLRVALFAEDELTRAGLAELLGVERRTDLVEPDASPDVVVLALRVVSASVMETLRTVYEGSGAPVVLVTSEGWDGELLTAVQFGVRAVLRRDEADRARLLRTVALVHAGGADLSTTLQGRLLAEVGRVQQEILAPRGLTASGLSDRELAVLRQLADGRDLREIADALRYSERTVKNILYTLLNRLGLHNRVHAVAYAMRAGLI